ncbi:hypothetical protein M9Y10_005573 [Tritrichomonas musculus]|uniref:Uncharacterized protein n=1 Tax=Tritrichomonas musculus TaxID=1915356 RepID=A0ABR2JDK7_9EUKA
MSDLAEIQIQSIVKEREKISKEIRHLRIQLDILREENSRIIEKLTIPKSKKLDFANILLFNSDWMTSYCIFKIIELKKEINDLEEKAQSNDYSIKSKLIDELTKLTEKRNQLLSAKQSLEDEYTQLIEESEKEKEQLKKNLNENI